MILCLAYVVVTASRPSSSVTSVRFHAQPTISGESPRPRILCGEWTETFLLQRLEPAGTPGFELLPELLGFAVARHDDVHMVRAAIDGVEVHPHPAMIGNGQFDEPALVLVEKAGIFPQAGLNRALASGIGKLPTVAVLDPPALIAGQPGAIRRPGQKIGQGSDKGGSQSVSLCFSSGVARTWSIDVPLLISHINRTRPRQGLQLVSGA